MERAVSEKNKPKKEGGIMLTYLPEYEWNIFERTQNNVLSNIIGHLWRKKTF